MEKKRTAWAWKKKGTNTFAVNYGQPGTIGYSKYLYCAITSDNRASARRVKHQIETVVKISLNKYGRPVRVIGRG